mmetsp:Transcript_11687/g.17994  ORF Transcript_11687/g.17994 Transcript_11687/m.17994 type:complete len:94 (-) Transcript_11687:241-522(-)
MVAQHWNHKFPERPLTHHPTWRGAGQSGQLHIPAWCQTNFEPNFSCQFEKRIGATGEESRGNGDGPKWICEYLSGSITSQSCLMMRRVCQMQL